MQEWRSQAGFNNSALPFFLVQLAPYYEPPCNGKQPGPCGIGKNFPCVGTRTLDYTMFIDRTGRTRLVRMITNHVARVVGASREQAHPHRPSRGHRKAQRLGTKWLRSHT